MQSKLLMFGYGYTAKALASQLDPSEWNIYGTSRSKINDRYCTIIAYSKAEIEKALNNTTHILVSIAPNENGDIVLQEFQDLIKQNRTIKWVGYLSSTRVYGNHDGAWVNENTKTKPSSKRGIQRVLAENQWIKLGQEENIAINIFRLSGIYGKYRNALTQINSGTARFINKPEQLFSRIHVEDIAAIIEAAIKISAKSEIYNLADDYPCASIEVNNYAASLLKTPPPKIINYELADLSDTAKEFYNDNKRVSNQKIKNKLGIKLKYPTYKEGLLQLFNAK